MVYLIQEIFLFLLAAAVIGGVLGWLLCKWLAVDRRARNPDEPEAQTPSESPPP